MESYIKSNLIKLIFLFFLLSGCSKRSSGVDKQQIVKEENILQGTYTSIKGIMNPLSCYCFNGGYLITKDNKEIPICFENDKDVQCNQITIKGNYKTKKNNTNTTTPTNPCPNGEMTYFNASSYLCN